MEAIITQFRREFWSIRGQIGSIRGQIEKLMIQWCSTMHPNITWPIAGYYRCRTCGRRYAVPWAEQERISWRSERLPVATALSHARIA